MGEAYDQLEALVGKDAPEGWIPLVDDTIRALNEVAPGWTCQQIKEKFGGLRFYFAPPEGAGEDLKLACEAIVQNAETIADRICQDCGEFAKLRKTRVNDDGDPDPFSWWLTLCDRHAVERNYQ